MKKILINGAGRGCFNLTLQKWSRSLWRIYSDREKQKSARWLDGWL